MSCGQVKLAPIYSQCIFGGRSIFFMSVTSPPPAVVAPHGQPKKCHRAVHFVAVKMISSFAVGNNSFNY